MICLSARTAIRGAAAALLIGAITGCATSLEKLREYERAGNVPKLSEVTRDASESPDIRRRALESLARLNWKPSNEERLQVYGLFAPQIRHDSAEALMTATTPDRFSEVDKEILGAALLLNYDGTWTDAATARATYDHLRTLDDQIVSISLCQQLMARPELQTRLLLLAIKLGLPGSEGDLVGILFVYGDKTMAEDYLNCGSTELASGARIWAANHGYRIFMGPGSHRSGWGRF